MNKSCLPESGLEAPAYAANFQHIGACTRVQYISFVCFFGLLFLPDQLDDGGEEGHADQDIDGADQHVRCFL